MREKFAPIYNRNTNKLMKEIDLQANRGKTIFWFYFYCLESFFKQRENFLCVWDE